MWACALRIRSAAETNAGRLRAMIATESPSAPRLSAIASPLPLLPPVTTALAPSKTKLHWVVLSCATDEVLLTFNDSGREVHDLADYGGVRTRNRDEGQHRVGHVGEPGHVAGNLAFLRPRPVEVDE